ncbi:hypothetical protein ACJJTC_000039 [Scirpophaga incertulas]
MTLRVTSKFVRDLRRILRLSTIPVLRKSHSQEGSHGNHSSHRFWWTTGSLGLALLAADHVFNEKRFFKAAQIGNVEELKRQVETLKVGWRGGDSPADRRHLLGWTALMAAAANDRPAAVHELLNLGAHPNLQDEYSGAAAAAGAAGLHPLEALQRREEDFCPAMNGRASFRGWTALHYAALADSEGCTRLLLSAGADPALRDHAGRRALHYARDPSPARALLLQEATAAAVRRRENGWADDEHPLVFLFLGSSGFARRSWPSSWRAYLHRDDPRRLHPARHVRVPGAARGGEADRRAAGVRGHEAGGQLTRALARRPDALVLLDEVDKAHPDVLAALLQLFDEGRLTDGKGKLIECKNAIFVMTSNLAAEQIAQHGLQLRREARLRRRARTGAGTASASASACSALLHSTPSHSTSSNSIIIVSRKFKDSVVRPILKRHFGRDEFLGRINEKRHNVELSWEDGVLGCLADGYDIHYGARSIKYEVERRVVSQIALAAERGLLAPGSAVRLAADGAALRLALRPPGGRAFVPLDDMPA